MYVCSLKHGSLPPPAIATHSRTSARMAAPLPPSGMVVVVGRAYGGHPCVEDPLGKVLQQKNRYTGDYIFLLPRKKQKTKKKKKKKKETT
jgi:hypothetical protein